jgi:aerobic carbon-monoxide dehydrogenase medium subunit
MKAPPFGYVRANTLVEAFRLWSEAGPEAKLLAGGQSLLATLAFRLSEPTVLVDISRVAELRGIAASGNSLRVGALTTHAELGADTTVRQQVPLLAAAVPLIAHPAVRNRGTIGGSLAYADPAAELPACSVALEATILARSATTERRISAGDFFRSLYTTALEPNELIAAVEFPSRQPGERSTILELARRSGDYAMAGIVARAGFDGGALIDPRIVFFGVGDVPVIAAGAMAALAGRPGTKASIAAAQAALDDDLDPPADLNGGADTKRHLARVLLARAVHRLVDGEEARAA